MRRALLGKTGLSVSRLCFGSLPFSPLQRDCSPEEAGELLGKAFALGINFIDTAQYYRNYPHIRVGLRRTKGDIVLATKTYAHTKALCMEAVEEARRETGRDMIDIFLLHEQESEHTLRGHREALDWLYTCKARGIIKAVGLSTHHIAGVTAAVQAGLDVVHPLINRCGLGIADGTREEMEAAIDGARTAGLGVYVMKALGGGHLYKEAGAALSYAMRWGDSVALGIRDMDELSDDIHFFECGTFPPNTAVQKNALRRVWVGDWCTGCGNCAKACKTGALTIQNGRAVCEDGRCVLCGYCGGRCKELCLKLI